MTPYAVGLGIIPDHVLRVFRSMREVVESLPPLDGEQVSSLAVCMFLEKCFTVQRVDGFFGKTPIRHSWITHPDALGVVIDMYPVASASPFIVYIGTEFQLLAWKGMYMPVETPFYSYDSARQVDKFIALTQR